jgi:hypothetical protein
MIFNKDKDELKLLANIIHLQPEEFLGLAHLLGVKLSVVNKETGEFAKRDAEEILEDVVTEFRKLKHKERKMILKVVTSSGSRT